jgi:putative ABC transport system permease protein
MRRLIRLFRKSRSERELNNELRFHLDEQIADNLAAGMTLQEARRHATLSLGGLERVKQEVRDSRWESYLENLIRDFHFALRTLRKDSRTSLVAICALALGISACTVVFSVVYNSFFQTLPYKDFRRSVVWHLHDSGNVDGKKDRDYFSIEEIRAFREQNRVFEETIAYCGIRLVYDDGTSNYYWPLGAEVSSNTFDYLGAAPLLGRGITPEDGAPNAPPVFVMNYGFWQSEFGGDPSILGKTFTLNDTPTTLVGIMPSRFNFFKASFWMPIRLEQMRNGGMLMGRLKNGISVQAATVDLDNIAHLLHKPSSRWYSPEQTFPEQQFTIVSQTLLDTVIGNFTKTLYLLLAAVSLLMLLACSNVANLLLARATARERELAMRATLGASRQRLIQQLLVECLVLATVSCGVGCVLAYFGLQAVIALIPNGTLPDQTVIRINAPVLLLSLGLTILTTILCGLAPAFHIVGGDLQPRLTGSRPGVIKGSHHSMLRGVLVVSEVALSIVLLIGAGLLMRSFFVLTRVDLGFNPQNIFYFEFSLPKRYNTDYADSLTRKNALTQSLLDRLRVVPGAIYVSEQNNMPPLESEASDTIIPGKPHSEPWETSIEECSAGYFSLLGLRSLHGRFFSDEDVAAARRVVVVNETFAKQFFPKEDALGRKVRFALFDQPYLAAPREAYFEIVGIVRDFKTRDYANRSWQTTAQAFMPYTVANYSWRSFMVRTAADPSSLSKTIAQEVRSLDPGVRIYNPGTLEGALREFYRGPQFELVTIATFAVVGLMLAVVGIFSVMAYAVSLRIHEIGVRMALGAQQTNILQLVLLSGFRLVATGILTGLFVSFALTRLLASQIPGVSPTDPWAFSGVALLSLCVGLAACAIPARRAASIDPLVALHYE